MTVSAQTPINRSTANGVTTVFPYNFKVLAAADLEVSLDGVVKTLTTDYTLSGVGDDAGGNVTMLSAPANGVTVVRRRNMAYIREVDYQDQGELPTDTLDDDQDAPILMIQQVAEGLSRAVSLPPESTGVSLTLPTPAALQYLRWNAAADALESVLLADVSLISLTAYAQTLLNAVDAAAARVVLGITTFGSSLVTAANAAAARIAMGAAASGANSDITSLTGLTTPLTRAQGGTGSNTSRTLIQEAYTSSGAVATGTTIIPFDDTVPQITEGDQYFSLAFTPTNAANILEFSAVIQLANSVSNSPLIAALFQVAVANSLKVAYTVQPTGSLGQITLIHEITAGATAATTYSIRAGGSGAGTTTLNGFSGGRFFGGVGTSFFRIREYTP